MKKIAFLIAFLIAFFLAMMMTPAKAQFFEGIEVGGGARYSRQSAKANVGVDVIATKSVADWARLRVAASVSGLLPNGFDRYGSVTCGVMAEVRPVYVFADFGLSMNPSAKPPEVGMAFDCGVGIKVALTSHLKIYSEIGIDKIVHGNLLKSTASVKAGLLYYT